MSGGDILSRFGYNARKKGAAKMTATVNDQSITITDESLTVSESVGIYECDFTFDASWDEWNKTAVFEGAGETIEMIVVDNKAQIPWEVLKEAGWIKIGVYGTKGGEIKPTIWSDQIYVAEGTVPGSVEVTPTPSIYAQILDLANSAKETAEDVAEDWAGVTAEASTLSAGSPASVSFANNKFTFGIPKGDTGATGAKGDKGDKGDNGDVTNIADAYSTSATYVVGDYCIYNSQLYRCTTAITTAEAWTAAHWTEVQLGDEVGDLKSAFDSVYDAVAYKIEIDTLNQATSFYVHSGETVTVTAKDGGAITAGQLRLRRKNGTNDYWTISGYTSRSIAITEEFVSAYLSGGTAQAVVIEKTGSYLNFQPQIDEIKTEVDKNTSSLSTIKPMVGINEPTFDVTDGKYISSDGSIVDANNFQYSAPIPVKAGQKVSLYAQGYNTSVAMISTVNSSGGNIAPKVISTETAPLTYEYTVKTDGYIAVSYIKNVEHRLIIYTYRIDQLESIMSEVVSVEAIAPSVNTGFIHRDGRIMDGSNFRYSDPIRLENETIKFKAKGYSNIVSLLSICDENGSNRINIVTSTNDDVVELSYKSNGVTYVIISSNVTQPIVYTTVKNILPTTIPYVNLSLFEKFGVIGDSYASGALFFNNTEKDDYAHSWGQIMARKLGTTCTNYSKGGLSTRTWLTDNKGLSLMQSSEPEDIYYLVLGINDYYSLGTSYLGSITDITSHSSYTDYPDTFYGNYGKIIEQIQDHAIHAKLVMFTIAGIGENSTRDAFNYAIIEIADHYGLPYIVQNNDPFFVSDFYNKTKVEGHPIAITYSGMADAFERLLINCIRNNVAYFRNTFCYD